MKVDIYSHDGTLIDSGIAIIKEISGDLMLDRKKKEKKRRFEFQSIWQREYFQLGHIEVVNGYLKGSDGYIEVLLKRV